MRSWRPKEWRRALGLDSRTVLMMLKGGLPPVIVTAMYQSTSIASITTTTGYLTTLIAITSQCLFPRAKFVKIMFFNLLSTCACTALCCLVVYCSVSARRNTSSSDSNAKTDSGYNSSACAVCAVWLIFAIWIANTLRALRPQELQDPMVAFSIFAVVAMTRASEFSTLLDGLTFVRQLLETFLLGFAIATGVSLLVVPTTHRGNILHGVKKYADIVPQILEAQISYLKDSEDDGALERPPQSNAQRHDSNNTRPRVKRDINHAHQKDTPTPRQDSNAKVLMSLINSLSSLHRKLHVDLFYAKHEVAWGKLSSSDLESLFALLRSLLLPLAGMSMLPEVVDKLITNTIDSREGESNYEKDCLQNTHLERWQRLLRPMCVRIESSSELVKAGLDFALVKLAIAIPRDVAKQSMASKATTTTHDLEALSDTFDPARMDFKAQYEKSLQDFYYRRKNLPKLWASLVALHSSPGSDNPIEEVKREEQSEGGEIEDEFFVLLYMEHLQDVVLQATFELVKFADDKVTGGTMDRNRLILPKTAHLWEWFSFTAKNKGSDRSQADKDSSEPGMDWAYAGDPLKRRLDPGHLPPANAFEEAGNLLRAISRFIASDQSSFGFRVAAASFTVGILAFLHQTQNFFFQQRLIWAMIVIVIGMSPTSGASLFGFAGRIFGTITSLALSLIVWYIVDEKTPGVLVLLFVANCFEYYFFIKYPRYISVWVITIVTLNVIVAYQLQVRKLGIQEATSNGQPYYPIYLFGPYKLACVTAGCLVSFIWVIFPYPISAGRQVRKTLGRSLFVLANFYSCMHTTIEVWMNEEQGDINDKESPARLLEGVRNRLFTEEMSLLASLQAYSHFTTFEPPIGGKFPKQAYDNIIAESEKIVICVALMAQATRALEYLSKQPPAPTASGSRNHEGAWIRDLATLVKSTDFNAHKVTSLLCHLSAAVSNGQALPPYLAPPDPFPMARQLRKLSDRLMDIRNVEDPGFSAFAAMEVFSSMVNLSLGELVSNVKMLVGEVSFDVYVRHGQAKEKEKEK